MTHSLLEKLCHVRDGKKSFLSRLPAHQCEIIIQQINADIAGGEFIRADFGDRRNFAAVPVMKHSLKLSISSGMMARSTISSIARAPDPLPCAA